MEIDLKIARVLELIQQRETINKELNELLAGSVKKPIKCSKCHQQGHTARTCKENQS